MFQIVGADPGFQKVGFEQMGRRRWTHLGGSGGMLPREIWKSSEMRFPAF